MEQTRRRRAVHGPQPGHHCFADKFALSRERFHQQYAFALLVWFTAAGFFVFSSEFYIPSSMPYAFVCEVLHVCGKLQCMAVRIPRQFP